MRWPRGLVRRMNTLLLLTTLLGMFPHSPQRECMERRTHEIAAMADAGFTNHAVPPAVLLTIGYLETHLGCDAGEGGGWGAPISRFHRHTAGTSDHAARALARSFAVCGTWRSAISRFRYGLCHPIHTAGYAPDGAMRIAERISARAGVPLPERWR